MGEPEQMKDFPDVGWAQDVNPPAVSVYGGGRLKWRDGASWTLYV